jgi:hypothetical protein
LSDTAIFETPLADLFLGPCEGWAFSAQHRASTTFCSFGLSRTSPASGIIPILNHDSLPKKSGY